MDKEIIIALFTVAASAISSLSLVNWRLKEIEKRLDSHNNYALKFADTATDMACMKKDIEYIKDRIDNI